MLRISGIRHDTARSFRNWASTDGLQHPPRGRRARAEGPGPGPDSAAHTRPPQGHADPLIAGVPRFLPRRGNAPLSPGGCAGSGGGSGRAAVPAALAVRERGAGRRLRPPARGSRREAGGRGGGRAPLGRAQAGPEAGASGTVAATLTNAR